MISKPTGGGFSRPFTINLLPERYESVLRSILTIHPFCKIIAIAPVTNIILYIILVLYYFFVLGYIFSYCNQLLYVMQSQLQYPRIEVAIGIEIFMTCIDQMKHDTTLDKRSACQYNVADKASPAQFLWQYPLCRLNQRCSVPLREVSLQRCSSTSSIHPWSIDQDPIGERI